MIVAGIAQLLNKVKGQAQGQPPQRPRPGQPSPAGKMKSASSSAALPNNVAGQPAPAQQPAPATFRRPEPVVQAEAVGAPGGA